MPARSDVVVSLATVVVVVAAVVLVVEGAVDVVVGAVVVVTRVVEVVDVVVDSAVSPELHAARTRRSARRALLIGLQVRPTLKHPEIAPHSAGQPWEQVER